MTDLNDRLDDIFGDNLADPTFATPKRLPQDEASIRIRQSTPEFSERCPKCRGSGRFTSYTGRQLGQCFTCKGAGKRTFATSPESRAKAAERRVEAKRELSTQFASDHPVEAQWLGRTIARLTKTANGSAVGYLTFLLDLQSASIKYGRLTENQMASITKGIARDAEFAAKRAEAPKVSGRTEQVDASRIVAAIQTGKASGLKWVCLRFNGLTIYEAKKHPGTLYVKSGRGEEGVYLGKIVEGAFHPSRDCDDITKAKVLLIANDPAAAAKVYGLETGSCCCCGRELTDKNSIALGIGPICAERFGF